MEPLRKELAEGVFLTYVPAAKFKTGVLGAQLITPLEESTVAAGALLPAVLRRGTTAHRDMRSIAAELDRLYGASIAYTVRKKGENQCLGFVGSFLDERYVPGGERLLEPMADLLGELLLDPLTRNGRFLSDYVESEKENLIDAIESILNDKRDYADARLLQEMCRGERYGIDRLGTVAGVERLTNQTLYRYYNELLATARIELFYCGSADCARVEGALDRALAALPRERVAEPAVAERVGAPETVREITGDDGRDAGEARHGLPRRERGHARAAAGEPHLRRLLQLQAVSERAREALAVLLCLVRLPPVQGHHHGVERH